MTSHPRLFIVPLIICSLLALAFASAPPMAAGSAGGRPEQTILNPQQPTGMPGLADTGYLSPVTQASPFTHMLLRWQSDEPAENTISIEARASLNGTSWTPWGAVSENHDLWQPTDSADTHWGATIYAGAGVRFWQVRASFTPAPDGRMPSLRRIDVNTVDARFGPENPAPEPALRASDKPAVISRTAWGNPDGQGSRVAPDIYPVNHIVVHHTADSNSLVGKETSWADRVRAEWSFHTYTRGWGDVGYNYLIDPNGVIYEGRAGGDDAVAFHDTANYGSMGVVVIGTYTSVEPTQAAASSLVDLLAWKSEQKRIDPLGSSYYYGCAHSTYCAPHNPNAIVANIAGHRQVTPTHTSCPGDTLFTFLPGIRQRVQARMNGVVNPLPTAPDDGDLNIDELEAGFSRTDTNWHDAACGYGGHSFYTYTTSGLAGDEPSTNSATWTPNIPTAGRYQVFAHIPQDCGITAITASARYHIHATQDYDVTINQNTGDEWASLGVFTFVAGKVGSVTLTDITGEPFSEGRAIFFDSVKWVPVVPSAQRIDLVNVQYDRTSVAAGDLLKVTFTVSNSGSTPIESQDPQAGTKADQAASFDLSNSYVYDEGECFLGATGQSYAAYPKEAGRFRLMLGPVETARAPACSGNNGGYPWRWGLNGTLAPGETRDVVGYIRFRTPGNFTLHAGAIEEYVSYATLDRFSQAITVTQELLAPSPISYDDQLRPVAYVYHMGSVPDNLLARTQDSLSVVKGALAGSFAWDGHLIDWGQGGPVADLNDSFIIEQSRVFVAPTAGEYAFQTTSSDGSWLWVDSTAVVANSGLHATTSLTGTINLTAGRHVLSFKYFDRSGEAVAGYSVKMPGAASFSGIIDGLGGSNSDVDMRSGSTFAQLHGITIAADDQGGSGVVKLRVSFDGITWNDIQGSVFTLNSLVDGSYTLHYTAVDAAGNESPVQTLSFRVDSTLQFQQTYLPMITR